MNKQQREQMIAQASAQGEAMLINTRYQGQAQFLQAESQQELQQAFPEMAQQQAAAQQGGGAPQQGGAPPQQGGGDPAAAQQQGAPPPGMEQQQQQPPQQEGGPVQGVEQSPVQAQQNGGMVDMFAQAKQLTSELKKMNEVDRYRAMSQIRASNPDLYMLVNNALSGAGVKSMNPLPEKLPSRADPDRAQV